MLKNYSVDESDPRREEKINSEYVGATVWIRATITEVAAEQPGQVLVNVDCVDDDGEDLGVDFLMAVDSDDIKITNDEDVLIDG